MTLQVYKIYAHVTALIKWVFSPILFCCYNWTLTLATRALRNAVGVDKLQSMMNRMTKSVSISMDKKLTNHSARENLIQKLYDNNVPADHTIQVLRPNLRIITATLKKISIVKFQRFYIQMLMKTSHFQLLSHSLIIPVWTPNSLNTVSTANVSVITGSLWCPNIWCYFQYLCTSKF